MDRQPNSDKLKSATVRKEELTPFDRFKEIASAVFQTPKSALPKTPKKSTRKK